MGSLAAVWAALYVSHKAGLPQVVSYLDFDKGHNCMHLVVKNCGTGVFHDVHFLDFGDSKNQESPCIGHVRTARAGGRGAPSHVAHPRRKQPIGTQHLAVIINRVQVLAHSSVSAMNGPCAPCRLCAFWTWPTVYRLFTVCDTLPCRIDKYCAVSRWRVILIRAVTRTANIVPYTPNGSYLEEKYVP